MAAQRRSILRVVPGPSETQQRVTSSVLAVADIRGIRHTDLAEKSAIDADKLSKSLNMKRKLTLEEMERLARTLEVPVAVLYEGGASIRRRALESIAGTHEAGPDDGPGLDVLYPPRDSNPEPAGCEIYSLTRAFAEPAAA